MLVVTRKAGESILIGENIEICILNAAEGNVKIGINAPKNIKIVRKELLKEIMDENIESVQNNDIIFKNLIKEGIKKEV